MTGILTDILAGVLTNNLIGVGRVSIGMVSAGLNDVSITVSVGVRGIRKVVVIAVSLRGAGIIVTTGIGNMAVVMFIYAVILIIIIYGIGGMAVNISLHSSGVVIGVWCV